MDWSDYTLPVHQKCVRCRQRAASSSHAADDNWHMWPYWHQLCASGFISHIPVYLLTSLISHTPFTSIRPNRKTFKGLKYGVMNRHRLKTKKQKHQRYCSLVHNTSVRPHEHNVPHNRLYSVQQIFFANSAEHSDDKLNVISRTQIWLEFITYLLVTHPDPAKSA